MEESTARKLRFLTVQVVGAVAVVHFVVGTAELVRLLNAGLLVEYATGGQALTQPEAWLFFGSSIAIIGGILAVAYGHLDFRRAYVLGIAVMAIYMVGWLAYHTVFDHGMAFGGDGGGHDHAGHSHGGLLTVVVSHYLEPLVGIFTGVDQPGQVTLAVVSKTLEAVALVLLAVLLRFDPRVETPENPVAGIRRQTDRK